MKGRYLWLTVLLVCYVIMGCATTAPYNPFKVPEDEFYNKVNTIALAPVYVPRDLEDQEQVKGKFESILEARLREAGFSVVPCEAFSQTWKQMTESLGGIYDPVTGKVDKSKVKTVRDNIRREMLARYDADAMLYPKIVYVKANFNNNTAKWDGVTENLRPSGFWKNLTLGNWQGHISALSFVISIRDVEGLQMYLNAGGIQALNKLGTFGKFVPVPREDLFANEERNDAAVDIAIAPMVKKSEPTEPSK